MVNYLTAYIWKQTDTRAVYTVDIQREVENFRRRNPNGRKPVVIFDFISTITILVAHRYAEPMCAGRHSECIRRAETLFKKFHDLGVDLVFFLDGLIKDVKIPQWIRSSNREYERYQRIFAELKVQELIIKYQRPKCLKTYYDNYLRVAKKYGRVFISLQNECDLDIAEFATRTKPLAVFADDSDFLIMPGDWPIWIPSELNVRDMTVKVWDKRKLRESLGLEQWQMPILATLSGCDWMEFKHVEHLWERFTGDLIQVEKALAGFIRKTFQNQKDLTVRIADIIYNGGTGELSYKEIERLVTMCLNFYDYKYFKITRPEPNWLRKHFSETGSCYIYSIYHQKVLPVSHSFVDLSKGVSSFSNLVLPLIRREIGIMYSNQREAYRDFKQKIALKRSEEEPFCIKEYTPVYPDFEVPTIQDILSNDDDVMSLEKRAELLAWVVSPKGKTLSVDNILKLLKTIFIVPALIVNYLVQEHQITEDEADILLLTIFEAFQMDPVQANSLRGPESIAEHPFWLSHLYTNLVHYFDEAMIFCGLFTYVPHSYFDGYLFHKIYAKYPGMEFDEKLAIRESISDYRLYAL